MRFIDHLGQPLPLEDWKSWNRTLADAYEELGLPSDLVRDCARHLELKQKGETTFLLHRTNYCRDLFCPVCNGRRNTLFKLQLTAILEELIHTEHRYQWERGTSYREIPFTGNPIYYTVTCLVPPVSDTVPYAYLAGALECLTADFARLSRYAAIRPYLEGSIRSASIRYHDRGYQIRLHCLLWMTEDYFQGKELSQGSWERYWKKATKTEDIRVSDLTNLRLKGTIETEREQNLQWIRERMPYGLSPDSFLELTCPKPGETDQEKQDRLRSLQCLWTELSDRSVVFYTGYCRKVKASLPLSSLENGDLEGPFRNRNGSCRDAFPDLS